MRIGTRVRIKDTYCDEACTIPVSGTIEDIIPNGFPDASGHFDDVRRFVVMFDKDAMVTAGIDPCMTPPGGEFSFDRLEVASALGAP